MGKKIRVIPKLEVKGADLIKGMHLEGLRVVGNLEKAAFSYYQDGADELIYIDLVASLYRRKYLLNIISKTAEKIFIPLAVGGGIKTIDDMVSLFRAGADKITINTGAIENPLIISEAARKFGSQCIIVSIEAKRKHTGKWEPYADSGRTPTGLDVLSWARRVEKLGAGEILITSIDQDGSSKGYDIDLVKTISNNVSIPVIACGGAGSPDHFLRAIKEGNADAVAAATIFHFNKIAISKVKKFLSSEGVEVRI